MKKAYSILVDFRKAGSALVCCLGLLFSTQCVSQAAQFAAPTPEAVVNAHDVDPAFASEVIQKSVNDNDAMNIVRVQLANITQDEDMSNFRVQFLTELGRLMKIGVPFSSAYFSAYSNTLKNIDEPRFRALLITMMEDYADFF